MPLSSLHADLDRSDDLYDVMAIALAIREELRRILADDTTLTEEKKAETWCETEKIIQAKQQKLIHNLK